MRFPTDLPPLEALARTALADPMVGSAADRAAADLCARPPVSAPRRVVISRIPGASHCAMEGRGHRRGGPRALGIPVVEIEVPPMTDALEPSLAHAAGGVETEGTGIEQARTRHDLRGNRRRIANHQGGACWTRGGREVLAAGVVDQGHRAGAAGLELLDRLLCGDRGSAASDLRRGRGHRLRAQADPGWPTRRSPKSPARPGASASACPSVRDHHRHRRPGQQVPAAGTPTAAIGDFVMNDRCAAGTGRFLEVLAARLGVRLAAPGRTGRPSRNPALISSMCVVFAETEIVGSAGLGRRGRKTSWPACEASLATRVAAMTGRPGRRRSC